MVLEDAVSIPGTQRQGGTGVQGPVPRATRPGGAQAGSGDQWEGIHKLSRLKKK